MIRFVYVGSQITSNKSTFAWFDTVIDRFLEFNNEQTWSSWDDFKNDYDGEEIDRFERLFRLSKNPLMLTIDTIEVDHFYWVKRKGSKEREVCQCVEVHFGSEPVIAFESTGIEGQAYRFEDLELIAPIFDPFEDDNEE
jgi:hypothetical protein